MGIEFSRGFFIFDKSWIQENQFVESLSHAEYRILIYLLSSALKISKRDGRYKRGDTIATLYQTNKILFVNASQRTMAERCNADRGTIYRALNKFKEYGALIKVPDSEDKGANDYYIIGFERDKDGKHDYYLVDSIPIRQGHEVPVEIREFILGHYRDPLFAKNNLIWERLFGMYED